jgi:hypothetical protein
MGFTFDDTNSPEISTSLNDMNRLIEENASNRDRIFAYLGGDELNSHPTHEHHRFVINFEDLSLQQAGMWPELLEIVRQKVKPDRDKLGGYAIADRRREFWWQYGTYTPTLFRLSKGKSRILAHSFTSAFIAFAFVPSNVVIAGPHNAFPLESYSSFCTLQCRIHELWATFFGSTMGVTLRYAPGDCFETFPFPRNWDAAPTLEAVGKSYYEFRAELMVKNNEGLTKTYNRFHDPEETSSEILHLRELHSEMDRAVLDAYGWTDISTHCEFILDYEDEEEEEGGGKRKKKKPWRYRWPDEVRDEVLARLLELNKQRYEEEVRLGLHTKGKAKGGTSKKSAGSEKPSFDFEGEEAE